MKNQVLVSIVIVNYKVKDKLFACLESIYLSKPKIDFEIIVVDNDGKKTIGKDLLKKFPQVKYLPSDRNLGYGGGNNFGARHALGKYLFFLNPDTEFIGNVIDNIYKLAESDKTIGIVAPVLLDKDRIEYSAQGTVKLTPFKALLHLSFLSRFFKKSHYFIEGWNSKGLKAVDVCPGSALMVNRSLFEKLKGFDEKFFLYFEEFDLCKRVKEAEFKIYIDAKARVMHEWGVSTAQFKEKDGVFRKSRFYYFKKHFGIPAALFTEFFLRINKFWIFLTLLFIFSFILRIYNLTKSMSFIGDQGWFYLSARDLLLTGKIPLVGIISSHTWLHQGPLWTYVLAVALFLGRFDPISGAFVTALFGAVAVVLVYRFGLEMFSRKVGIIAALLYAVSPLITSFDRMPYHTSPVPFFTLIYFFALFKWLKGNSKYLPLIVFLLATLYNFELATFTLFFVFAFFIVYGLLRKKEWFKNVLDKRIVLLSVIALFPMIPVIIYDFTHGFKQTVVFTGWVLYKPFSIFMSHSAGNLFLNFGLVFNFLVSSLQQIIFQFNFAVAILIFVFSLIYLCIKISKQFKIESSYFILGFLLLVSFLGILINQSPSDAYLPIAFPFIIFTVALFFDYLMSVRGFKYISIVILSLFIVINTLTIINMDKNTGFKQRVDAVNKIIKLVGNNSYNLIGKGQNSQFSSFTMNYEYLLWWKGHQVSKRSEKMKIVVLEKNGEITIYKE